MSWVITGREAGSLGLLDQYAGAAAAYSLRSLTLYYTGPVVRVRRSSDNTEQDFTAAQVTDGTLVAFCGAGNGFVRSWYDQSGNANHATQASSSFQPLIVSSGALITTNGKSAVQFADTGASKLSFTRISNIGSVFGIYKSSQPSGSFTNFLLGDTVNFDYSSGAGSQWLSSEFALLAVRSGSNYLNSVLTNFSTTTRTSDQRLISMIHESATARANTISQDRNDSTRSWRGTIQELLLYPSLQTSNRSGIESSINAHYAIY
jgi:hypothetical protein